jgi:mannose-6-phosphate isomerase-like protein (cupin superfamily)
VEHIIVRLGERLSKQMHHYRAEHWVVVSGTAEVEIDGQTHMLSENESCCIPTEPVHRLTNPGKVDLHLIEVQSGSYQGEDDIVRFENIYGRLA